MLQITEVESLVTYAGSRMADFGLFRDMTLEEMKSLEFGSRQWFRTIHADARQCTINGKPRTWKRNAARVEDATEIPA